MVRFATEEQIQQNMREKAQQRERDWNALPLQARVASRRAGDWLCPDCFTANVASMSRCYNCDRPNLPRW